MFLVTGWNPNCKLSEIWNDHRLSIYTHH